MKTLIVTTALVLLAGPAFAGNGGSSIIRTNSAAYSQSASQANNHNSVRNSVASQNANSNTATANNAGNNQSTNFQDRRQAPAIANGSLAATGECPIGSISLGGSGPGFGALFGMTTGDKQCRDVYLIKQGWSRHDRASMIVQQYLLNENASIRKAATGK